MEGAGNCSQFAETQNQMVQSKFAETQNQVAVGWNSALVRYPLRVFDAPAVQLLKHRIGRLTESGKCASLLN